MNRRNFSQWTACALATSGSLFSAGQVGAQPLKPVEGQEFLALASPVATDVPSGQMEVLEFFRYSCPHCFEFETVFEPWAKRLPKNVVLRRNPVSMGDEPGVFQRLYYALEAMGLLDSLHAKVFDAIHVQRLPLNTDSALADWIAKQGVDRAKFVEQQTSPSVLSKVKRASMLQDAFKIDGVPSFGVGGRYYTGGSLMRTRERSLQVVDFLIYEIGAGRR